MKLKVLSRLAGFFCVVAFSACRDNDAFVLTGEVTNPPAKVKTVYLLEPDSVLSYSMTTVDSATLSDDHRFSFKRQAFFPTFYKVLIGGTTYDIIARNGDDISLKMNLKDTTNAYEISGSEDSEKMRESNKLNSTFSAVTTRLSNEYGALLKKAKTKTDSDALYKRYYPQFIANMDAFGTKAWAFVEANKDNLAGYMESKTLDRYKYESQLVAYADEIKDKFAGNKDVHNFVKAMMAVKPVSVGHKAPDFTIMDQDNKPVKLSDYKGKYVMLDFWASWCQPCRQENPNVVKQYAAFKDKGLNILSITLDEDRKAWLQAVAADKLTWRHAAEFKRFDGPVVKQYMVQAIPSNFIIDPQGVIVAKNITGVELEQFLNKTFSKSQ